VSLSEKAALILSGMVYVGFGVLIILKPKFLYYYVAGAFFVQGVTSIIRGLGKQNMHNEIS
jgi:uncharacterized membrane protein HdeD (DUF308 family)